VYRSLLVVRNNEKEDYVWQTNRKSGLD